MNAVLVHELAARVARVVGGVRVDAVLVRGLAVRVNVVGGVRDDAVLELAVRVGRLVAVAGVCVDAELARLEAVLLDVQLACETLLRILLSSVARCSLLAGWRLRLLAASSVVLPVFALAATGTVPKPTVGTLQLRGGAPPQLGHGCRLLSTLAVVSSWAYWQVTFMPLPRSCSTSMTVVLFSTSALCCIVLVVVVGAAEAGLETSRTSWSPSHSLPLSPSVRSNHRPPRWA